MKRILVVFFVSLIAVSACGQLSDYEKVPDKGIETDAGLLTGGSNYEITSYSVLFTNFFKAEETGGKMIQMRKGDVVQFTGWTVTFPTGLAGYEFQVVKTIERDEEAMASNDMPDDDEKLYLSAREITKHLKKVD